MSPFGVPVEFILFALVLAGIALAHRGALWIALGGLALIVVAKLALTDFDGLGGLAGLGRHLGREGVTLANLFLLLTGFAMLANQFERSAIPEALHRVIPSTPRGAAVLVAIVFTLSIGLDNIAAAVIGGVIARHLFGQALGVGLLAAIVAAANAGGAGSVLGDTTTTMMWISGVSPFAVLHAFVGAGVALAILMAGAAWTVHGRDCEAAPPVGHPPIQWSRAGIVLAMLATLLVVNFTVNGLFPDVVERAPWLGLGLWAVILATAPLKPPAWAVLRPAVGGAVFLVSLVASASMMPVHALPAAAPATTFGLGLLSAVFDNIPLTALALKQGGYDWGVLAFAVGFGGSMAWFGSSAGVALTNEFPQGRSLVEWLRRGWFVPVAYVAGFAALMLVVGWSPTPETAADPAAVAAQAR